MSSTAASLFPGELWAWEVDFSAALAALGRTSAPVSHANVAPGGVLLPAGQVLAPGAVAAGLALAGGPGYTDNAQWSGTRLQAFVGLALGAVPGWTYLAAVAAVLGGDLAGQVLRANLALTTLDPGSTTLRCQVATQYRDETRTHAIDLTADYSATGLPAPTISPLTGKVATVTPTGVLAPAGTVWPAGARAAPGISVPFGPDHSTYTGNGTIDGALVRIAIGGGPAPRGGADLVVDGSVATKVTAASHSFTAADVGNVLTVTNALPGAWVPGTYAITAVLGGAATLARSPAPGGTAGGAWTLAGAGAGWTYLAACVVVDPLTGMTLQRNLAITLRDPAGG